MGYGQEDFNHMGTEPPQFEQLHPPVCSKEKYFANKKFLHLREYSLVQRNMDSGIYFLVSIRLKAVIVRLKIEPPDVILTSATPSMARMYSHYGGRI